MPLALHLVQMPPATLSSVAQSKATGPRICGHFPPSSAYAAVSKPGGENYLTHKLVSLIDAKIVTNIKMQQIYGAIGAVELDHYVWNAASASRMANIGPTESPTVADLRRMHNQLQHLRRQLHQHALLACNLAGICNVHGPWLGGTHGHATQS